ncbi:hypothetical protein MTO96_031876 [Rhipicephalus appendiculatus]
MTAANVDHMASVQNTDNVHAITMKRKGQPSRLPTLRESASRGRLAARRGVPMLRQKWAYRGKMQGQLNVSVTYGGTTLEATLVVLGCSGPDLCGRDVIKAFEQHGRQVLAVETKAAPDTEHPGTTRHVGDSVWYRNYWTGDRWKAGVVQAPEGHRMVTIKAADGEHHRRHYDHLRARRTDSAGLATGEAEVKQEAGVEAPQTEAGENGAPETSREGPQSPGAPDADSRPNMDDNQVGNDVSGAQSDSNNKESDPGETVLRRSTRNRRPPDRYQP